MKLPKLIAMDLDGTILEEGIRISDRVLKALAAVRERGVVLTIATGRSLQSCPEELLDGRIFAYAMVANGALTLTLPEAEIIDSEMMKSDDLLAAMRRLEALGYCFTMQTEGAEYYEERRLKQAMERNARFPERWEGFHLYLSKTVSTPSIFEILEKPNQDIVKISASNIYVEDSTKLAEEIAESLGIEAAPVSPREIEFTSRKATKGLAVRKLAERLGIAKADVIAFGDGGNDVSFPDGAGRVYAVENARPELIAVADEVILGILQDGVAQVLEGLLAADPA